MKYVALLRGINVGGNHRVEMDRLKAVFEAAGYQGVTTYINSGNVVFESVEKPVAAELQKRIAKEFGFEVPLVVVSANTLCRIADSIPDGWQNDTIQKSDVVFLFPAVDDASIVMKLGMNSDIETGVYVPGALLVNIERRHQSRSSMLKVVGTPLYQHMTIRNINTARKLAELVAAP
ncbi:MAG: DUF1697 domain-containing protein [Candidatus Saccharimonadales bacterium]